MTKAAMIKNAMSADAAMEPVISAETERACTRFLYLEAELLDTRRFEGWFDLLSPEIDYRIPVRTTREKKDGDGFSRTAFFMEEDYSSLKSRVARFGSDFAWAENPPTRTRRLVSNVRLRPHASSSAQGDAAEEIVASNFAVYCFRSDTPHPVVLTGERQDMLQRHGQGWKLKSRLVLLDTTVLGLESLSIFL